MVCTINGTSNIDQMFPHFVDHVILEWIFTHVSGVTSPKVSCNPILVGSFHPKIVPQRSTDTAGDGACVI